MWWCDRLSGTEFHSSMNLLLGPRAERGYSDKGQSRGLEKFWVVCHSWKLVLGIFRSFWACCKAGRQRLWWRIFLEQVKGGGSRLRDYMWIALNRDLISLRSKRAFIKVKASLLCHTWNINLLSVYVWFLFEPKTHKFTPTHIQANKAIVFGSFNCALFLCQPEAGVCNCFCHGWQFDSFSQFGLPRLPDFFFLLLLLHSPFPH